MMVSRSLWEITGTLDTSTDLIETVLLSIHNICFGREMRKLNFWYAVLTKVLHDQLQHMSKESQLSSFIKSKTCLPMTRTCKLKFLYTEQKDSVRGPWTLN